MTTANTLIPSPSQPLYVVVEYQRRHGETTHKIKNAFEINHGDLNKGLIEIDEKIYDLFYYGGYGNRAEYFDRESVDFSESEIKEPLKPFWISFEEVMGYVGHVIIPKSDYDILIKYI